MTTDHNDDDDNDDVSNSDSDSNDNSTSSTIGSNGISDYERLRLARIERNQTRLRELGLLKIKAPPKKKQKLPKKIDAKENTVVLPVRRSNRIQENQPGRSAKKKLRNKELTEQIRPNENTVTVPMRRYSKRIQENRHDLQSTIAHRRETTVEFDIETGIMNDIAERLIDLDDDSYIDEEDLDDNDADAEDEDNHKDVQSMVKFKPGAAMTTDEVRLRLKELQVITAEQFNSPDLNIRFAEENDFSARTKKELQ